MPKPVRRSQPGLSAVAAGTAARPKRVVIEQAPPVPTAAARAFNASGHTWSDLQAFVSNANSGEVSSYFGTLGRMLGNAVPQEVRDALGRLMKNPSAEQLAAERAPLQRIIAADASGFTALQSARAQALQPGAPRLVPKQQVLTGTVSVDAQNHAWLKTGDGRTLALGRGARWAGGDGGLSSEWLLGFKNDPGPLTVRGTWASDGQTLLVEDFAPGSSGEFVAGRVRALPDKLVVDTPRGEVEITNPELKAKLSKLPQLGVLLPGAAGPKGYAQNPEAFYALGRFRDANAPVANAAGVYEKIGDFAMSTVALKPIRMPALPAQDRSAHTARFLAYGSFELSAGQPVAFNATYFTTPLTGSLSTATYPVEGDPVSQAIFTTRAGAAPKDTQSFGPAPDFARAYG